MLLTLKAHLQSTDLDEFKQKYEQAKEDAQKLLAEKEAEYKKQMEEASAKIKEAQDKVQADIKARQEELLAGIEKLQKQQQQAEANQDDNKL